MQKHLHVISKQSAERHGLKKYFTGKPCINSHIDERTVSEGRCIECARDKGKRLYRRNKDAILSKKRNEIAQNPEKSRETRRESYRKNKHKWKKTRKRYAEENRDKMNAYYRERMRQWRETPEGKATTVMRHSISRVMGSNKDKRTEQLLGYTHSDFIEHIERQFLKGMSWENHGEWHVDHIIPIAHFLKNGETDPKVINALSNLRPLWASENMAKKDKIETLL